LAVGSVQLAVGSWQLAVGSWQLAVGSTDFMLWGFLQKLVEVYRLNIPKQEMRRTSILITQQ